MKHADTIVAPATPQGVGAIALVRVSGGEAITLVNGVFRGKDLTQVPSHTVHFGTLRDAQNQIIDEVVVSIFREPTSFTKENLVEISCHGSPYIVQKIMERLISVGCRLAQAGEFTQRAFLNGRFDLAQAEAVADLIASDSEATHQIALRQLKGGFSKDLQHLREQLIRFTALIELELDFGEEDVEFADRTALSVLIAEISKQVLALKNSFRYGNVLKNGIPTVIAGRPNAGKSTLLNCLLNEERAIVSSIAGTTRDTIEENLTIQGIKFRLTDTAGIRTETQDEIEKIGIERTLYSIEKSSILMYLFDASDSQVQEVLSDVRAYKKTETTLLLIGNKIDLLTDTEKEFWTEAFKALHQDRISYDFLGISAKNNINIALIRRYLYGYATKNAEQSNTIVVNARHYEALHYAYEALKKVSVGIENCISGELLSMDIKTVLYYIGTITGGEVEINRDILGAIFSKFCIGK